MYVILCFSCFLAAEMEIIMKKVIVFIVAALSALSISSAVCAGDNVPSVYLNGEKLTFTDNVNPYIDEASERTLVPMRDIFEAVGATIQWDEATNTVIAVKGDSFVTLQIGSPKAFVNSKEYILDVNAVIKEDKTFVPLRFVSEALGAQVDWDNDNYAVIIATE